MSHFVELQHIAYPLMPNAGWASEHKTLLMAEPGYSADVIAEIRTRSPRETAVQLAAAMDGVAPDQVRVVERFWRRETYRAVLEHVITETDEHIRYSPTKTVTRAEYNALIWQRP